MDFLKNWFLTFTIATLLTSILKLVLAKSRIKNTTNILFSVFIICYLIIPFGQLSNQKIKFQFDFNRNNLEDIEIASYENIIINSVKAICVKNEINVIDIEIKSYIDSKTNDVIIEKIIVVIVDKSKIDYLKEKIETELGFEVRVC